MPRDPRTYITVHDGLPDHPKIESLDDAAFRALITLWCWCSRNKTDGFIKQPSWDRRVPVAIAKQLLDAGLAHATDGGVQMHDYTEHQRTAAEIEALQNKRSEAGRRGGLAKAAKTLASAKASAVANGKQTASKVVADTDTDKETSLSEIADAIPDKEPVRDDVTRLCQHLQAKIVENGSKRPNITQAWRRECRLLLDRDGKTEQQVMAAIDWCQADSFWKTNILSMPKLREKYDQIRLKAQEQRGVSQTALRSVPEPFTPEPPPPEIADDPEACERWYTDQYARRSA